MTHRQTGWIMAGLGIVLLGFLCGGFVAFAMREPYEALAIVGVVVIVGLFVGRNGEDEG